MSARDQIKNRFRSKRNEKFPDGENESKNVSCDCQEFWIDHFKNIRCRFCEPPPSENFIAEEFFNDDSGTRWLVIKEPDGERWVKQQSDANKI